jgi:uncharacterized Zn finger protein
VSPRYGGRGGGSGRGGGWGRPGGQRGRFGVEFRPYVPVAVRRQNAALGLENLKALGHTRQPVVIEGRTIARTFWGRAWCDNLERYSDFANRLPRGRTYVRNGSVVDLQIAPGEVKSRVSGSSLYDVRVGITGVVDARWSSLCHDCGGAIDSLVELLQGRFSKAVMERLCQPKTGLFPGPAEIEFSCTCPDWASMCKHVAATLYGVGARLDQQPELLFRLRKVHERDLLAAAAREDAPLTRARVAPHRVLQTESLSTLFGFEIVEPDDLLDVVDPGASAAPTGAPAKKRAGGRKPVRSRR